MSVLWNALRDATWEQADAVQGTSLPPLLGPFVGTSLAVQGPVETLSRVTVIAVTLGWRHDLQRDMPLFSTPSACRGGVRPPRQGRPLQFTTGAPWQC